MAHLLQALSANASGMSVEVNVNGDAITLGRLPVPWFMKWWEPARKELAYARRG